MSAIREEFYNSYCNNNCDYTKYCKPYKGEESCSAFNRFLLSQLQLEREKNKRSEKKCTYIDTAQYKPCNGLYNCFGCSFYK